MSGVFEVHVQDRQEKFSGECRLSTRRTVDDIDHRPPIVKEAIITNSDRQKSFWTRRKYMNKFATAIAVDALRAETDKEKSQNTSPSTTPSIAGRKYKEVVGVGLNGEQSAGVTLTEVSAAEVPDLYHREDSREDEVYRTGVKSGAARLGSLPSSRLAENEV